MPREGVPYPGREICSIKCKLKEIWNALQGKLHSINGVQGDGQGNVKIVAGSGIVVNNDAAQNQIEIVNTGATPEGLVESVNGILPDEDGDVQIDTGLLTVNGEAPDADGEFSITAGTGIQINESENGIEIENTSQGAIYTGVSPIEVNADNEINLKDWHFVETNNDWNKFISNVYNTTEDLIVVKGTMQATTYTYIPKNTPTATPVIMPYKDSNYSNNSYWDVVYLSMLLRSGASTSNPGGQAIRYRNKITSNTGYYNLEINEQVTINTIYRRTGRITDYFSESSMIFALMVRS